MSDYTVIRLVNERLREVLFQGLRVGDASTFLTSGSDSIHIGSPSEAAGSQQKALSVFLYQVTEDPHLKNRPPLRTREVGVFETPPMALRLHYMLTPLVENPEGNALILGKVLEVLYDNSTLTIFDGGSGAHEEVRVVFETLTLSELAEVWEALKESYRLSIAYQVRVPVLQSTRSRTAIPVGEAARTYSGIA